MHGVKPEFEKYQKALERVNNEVNARRRKLLQMCWNNEPPNRDVASDLRATAPYLTEKGWMHEIHCALDKLEDINLKIGRLETDESHDVHAFEVLADRLFDNKFRALSSELS